MASIGQSFFTPYVTGSFITSLDLYFNTVDTTSGVTVQIRETQNGAPTNRVIGSAIVTNCIADPTGQNATHIVFNDPVYVESNTLYFLAIIPLSNNPNFTVWTATLGGSDINSGKVVQSFAGQGSLFLSSNDATWTANQNETLKFNFYFAQFKKLSNIVYENKNYEFIEVVNTNSSFISGEPVVLQSGIVNTAVLSISSSNGISNNQLLTQGNTTGTIYFANTTTIKVLNCNGVFANGIATTPTGNASITTVNQTISLNSNNSLNVPDSSVYNVNSTYIITTSNGLNFVAAASNVNANTITLTTGPSFADSNTVVKSVVNNLTAVYKYSQNNIMFLTGSNASTVYNFDNVLGNVVCGVYSGAIAKGVRVVDMPYQTINMQLPVVVPAGTTYGANLISTSNSYVQDISSNNIILNQNYNLNNNEKIIASRTHEVLNMSGGKSLQLNVTLATNNSRVSPYINKAQQSATIINNIISEPQNISGVLLFCNNNTLTFKAKDIITQGNSIGRVVSSNTSSLYCSVSNGAFTTGTITNVTNSLSSNVTSVQIVSEESGVVVSGSRYISKKVVLQANQAAEDLQVYLTAYRPANTNLFVFTKIINTQDPTTYYNGTWTRMVEDTSSSNLYSSSANTNNTVELQYNMPSSQTISSGITVTSNTAAINVGSTPSQLVIPGEYCYLSGNGSFMVTEIIDVTSNSITVSPAPTFSSTNTTLGVIPNLTSLTGAFNYDGNSNVTRYVSNKGVVYDTFTTLAVKIVPVASNDVLVPYCDNMRAIALQV